MTYGTLKRARVRAALAWLLQNPAITAPIVGATKPYHLEDAGGALSFKLSDEEVTALKEPYVPHPLVGFE
jgi:1-deoxyxylulose-5-phosphate synthase